MLAKALPFQGMRVLGYIGGHQEKTSKKSGRKYLELSINAGGKAFRMMQFGEGSDAPEPLETFTPVQIDVRGLDSSGDEALLFGDLTVLEV